MHRPWGPQWRPEVGELVRFQQSIYNVGLPIVIMRPTHRGYVRGTAHRNDVFMILGELDHDEKLSLYGEPGTPSSMATLNQRYFWCLHHSGVVVLGHDSLQQT